MNDLQYPFAEKPYILKTISNMKTTLSLLFLLATCMLLFTSCSKSVPQSTNVPATTPRVYQPNELPILDTYVSASEWMSADFIAPAIRLMDVQQYEATFTPSLILQYDSDATFLLYARLQQFAPTGNRDIVAPVLLPTQVDLGVSWNAYVHNGTIIQAQQPAKMEWNYTVANGTAIVTAIEPVAPDIYRGTLPNSSNTFRLIAVSKGMVETLAKQGHTWDQVKTMHYLNVCRLLNIPIR
jgi:hypothetical protein